MRKILIGVLLVEMASATLVAESPDLRFRKNPAFAFLLSDSGLHWPFGFVPRFFHPRRSSTFGLFRFGHHFLGHSLDLADPDRGSPLVSGFFPGLRRSPRHDFGRLPVHRFGTDVGSVFAPDIWSYGPVVMGPSPSPTWNYVKEWKNRPPNRPEMERSQTPSFDDSLLLQEGMGEAEVMNVLGSPLERVRWNQQEWWRYSGYTLYFDSGKLKAIQ